MGIDTAHGPRRMCKVVRHQGLNLLEMMPHSHSVREPTRMADSKTERKRDLGERARSALPAVALAVGLATLTAHTAEGVAVRDIQRYCTACWRNARIDPGVWDDCTQEVCVRLLTKARAGDLDLTQVLSEETPERRELVRAIDMVRKRVQRARRTVPLADDQPEALAGGHAERLELGDLLLSARKAALSERQDQIIELLDARLDRPRHRRTAQPSRRSRQRRKI